ncbi:MAG: threonylcarbamoyl-AMP synthase [Desulfobacterales bacterium]|nr:threonylcarbamoyl-AMP synthase [Desulfobacterales bacterium]MBF0397903.1 threonylcarbamoyl-AMP synthase [Desulfobacterales bacterium]
MKKTKSLIRKINPVFPESHLIEEAALFIREGKIVAFPTQFLYGLGADALNKNAVDKIFNIKKRNLSNPILVLIKNKEELTKLVKHIPDTAISIMNRFWPGGVTIVFEAKADLPVNLTAGTGKIGVRIPSHPVSVALVNGVDLPITATSANISGFPGCSVISDFGAELLDEIDLILDAGILKGGKGSTVIDVTVNPPKILRQGEIAL